MRLHGTLRKNGAKDLIGIVILHPTVILEEATFIHANYTPVPGYVL